MCANHCLFVVYADLGTPTSGINNLGMVSLHMSHCKMQMHTPSCVISFCSHFGFVHMGTRLCRNLVLEYLVPVVPSHSSLLPLLVWAWKQHLVWVWQHLVWAGQHLHSLPLEYSSPILLWPRLLRGGRPLSLAPPPAQTPPHPNL